MKLERKDWLWMLALAVAAFGLRAPFRNQIPFHWDAAQFAIAVTDYDIARSQPHAPGYFLYVMAGKLVNFVTGDPHAALVWLSVMAGSLLVPVLYWLGAEMFDRRTGLIAGLLAMTSPQTWFHSEVALTYIVDALLVSATLLAGWRAMQRGGTWRDAVLIGTLLAVIGGIRPQSVPALLPAIFYIFWRFDRPRITKLVVAGTTALALGLAWFVPMVAMTGWDAYFEIVRRHAAFNAPATWIGGGFDALRWNLFLAALFSLNGLMLAAVALPAAMKWRSDAQRLLVLWSAAAFVMGTFVGFTKQPGYVLNLLPGLLVLAASALARWRWPVAAVVCGFNVFTFLAWPAAWDGVLGGVGRHARVLREHERATVSLVEQIRQRYSPRDSFICHATDLYFGLRQWQVALPEFDQYQLPVDPTMLTPKGRPIMAVRDGRLTFVAPGDWAGKRRALLVAPPGLSVKRFEPFADLDHAQPVPGTDGMLYEIGSEWLR